MADTGRAVYVAYDANGTPSFSTQPYSSDYTLYMREPSLLPRTTPETRGKSGTSKRLTTAAPHIDGAAKKHGIDVALLAAVVEVESGFDTRATSPKGAMGAMQLIPSTAAQYGVFDPYDLQQNLDGGARYLKDLIEIHNGNLALALAAYNAGRGRVAKNNHRIPPIRETMLYVPHVLARMAAYQQNQEGRPK